MKFICDAMLGKLAKYLRILGLDAEYANNPLVLDHYKGEPEPPYFLTKRLKGITYPKVVLIRSDKPRDQLLEVKEIIRPYINREKIMNRCIECNVELADVDKYDIEQRVPEFVFHQYSRFRMCPQCRKVYWEGSHAVRMGDLIKEIMEG
ncbi:Mut7-C RNAse domain-containing protein [Syntrophorhabdus aromaticivorans]|mgnify:CR=1 FL=1|uniref:Mut7-C RNAse domain-containing protein n=1 Tax=Syntrophorhabdus aromaticivorans TaxID=328301 RepID=A0A351U1S6_9BACT|nr:Mut7-C RNAse domain-containing protein [Syntrophorhabdus aromaticivorans]NLW36798.1 hypothetical protein [Syntrophorhabdus aromaticivorans]HBA53907.1 hypothetical protein [Syntrophorhabdus aromaticivorans]